MKTSQLIFVASTLAVGNSTVCTAAMPKKTDGQKPNILLILADDLGLGDLSCQYATDIRTPNIDHLFMEGVRLDQFYSSSSASSPSRAGLMTGCYPDMVGVPGLIRSQENGNWGYLSPDAILLPAMLKEAGYKTAHIGKWNLGLESPNLPNERGYDYYHGFLDDMMDDYYSHLRKGKNFMRLNDTEINPKGHATELFTEWTEEYIKKAKYDTEPFFIYLAYNAPHLPLQPPIEYEQKVREREPGISETRGKLVALIEHLDYNIGIIVKTLERTGQLDNTVIIFCSDNGGASAAEANNGPTRGYKTDMYEGGIRVPCAVYWRGKLKPARYDNLVMMSDIYPTLCELAGVEIRQQINGISVLPLFKEGQQITDERVVFWTRREHGELCGKTQDAARYKEYKLLQNRPFEPLKYYNLNKDPLETNPLPKDKTYQKLFKAMMEHNRKAGAVPWEKPLNRDKK